jgi:5-methylcytosine-specific restriction protein A
MVGIESLIFRKLTDADFFNINKPAGTEAGGGGQSYIDISTSAVTLRDWRTFLQGVSSFQGEGGVGWTVPIHSLGTTQPVQDVKIAQRREASVSIREQKITSRANNRVHAWSPALTGFPKPVNPAVRAHIYNLHIYIVKLTNGEYWAGWFDKSRPEPNWATNQHLNKMFTESEGYVTFTRDVLFDTGDAEWPFRIANATDEITDPVVPSQEPEREVGEKVLFDEDEADSENAPPKVKEVIRKIRQRNTKAVKNLKELYGNKCQVTGEKYTFPKRNGELYSEAHHLIPLGEGGADKVHNIVIVSPLIHRMFHHARIEGLDLDRIRDNKLMFKINDVEYTIEWHPDHAQTVEEFNQ